MCFVFTLELFWHIAQQLLLSIHVACTPFVNTVLAFLCIKSPRAKAKLREIKTQLPYWCQKFFFLFCFVDTLVVLIFYSGMLLAVWKVLQRNLTNTFDGNPRILVKQRQVTMPNLCAGNNFLLLSGNLRKLVTNNNSSDSHLLSILSLTGKVFPLCRQWMSSNGSPCWQVHCDWWYFKDKVFPHHRHFKTLWT